MECRSLKCHIYSKGLGPTLQICKLKAECDIFEKRIKYNKIEKPDEYLEDIKNICKNVEINNFIQNEKIGDGIHKAHFKHKKDSNKNKYEQ